MSFGEESTRTDQPNFPPQRFLTKAIRTARMSRQRLTKWWVGLKMDLKKIWPDISSVNTLPPKSQCDVLDLSVLCPACVRLLIFSTCSTIALMGARELSKILYFQRPGDQLRSSVQYQLFSSTLRIMPIYIYDWPLRLTAMVADMQPLYFWASYKLNKFSNFFPLSTFDS
jgi:hypothetical protein